MSEASEVECQLADYLKRGFILPSSFPWASPILLVVKKKDGSMHLSIDYRGLNAATIKNKYPLPQFDELFDQLRGAKYFSKIDVHFGYHQVCIRPEDVTKTIFCTCFGHYEFLVMPFGVTNALATFMTLIYSVLQPFLEKFVIVFLEDILIYSASKEEHLHYLKLVFELLRKHALYAKESKCNFFQTKIHYLGHVTSADGLRDGP